MVWKLTPEGKNKFNLKQEEQKMTIIKWTGNPVLNEMLNGVHKKAYHGNCQANRPAANIIEDEKAFSIELAVPGMAKNDFNIKLEDDILSISAEIKEEDEKNGLNYTRREFRYDGFCRSFSIPEIVDQDKIKADYKNGVLIIKLPKSEEAKVKGREISVS
jgi:HSP20 family protein